MAALAFGVGLVLWFVAAEAAGRREAWDAGIYWSFFYPLSLAVAGILGYLFPERPWRWAAALFLGQLVAMTLRNGEIGNLFPLGLIVFGALSIPAVVLAQFGARVKAGRRHP